MLFVTMSLVSLLWSALLACVQGHAWMQQPPGRSSAWRFGFPTPKNFNDNGLNCGGRGVQQGTYGGKCGLCGDSYGGPRLNEPGPDNVYATGVIVANYTQGQAVAIKIQITAQHKGYHEFRLFKNDVPQLGKDPAAAVPCGAANTLLSSPDGRTRFDELDSAIVVRLPGNVTCEACILQWRWRTGNSWGCDEEGCGLGYGPQEEFISCADVRIVAGDAGGCNSSASAADASTLPGAAAGPVTSNSGSSTQPPTSPLAAKTSLPTIGSATYKAPTAWVAVASSSVGVPKSKTPATVDATIRTSMSTAPATRESVATATSKAPATRDAAIAAASAAQATTVSIRATTSLALTTRGATSSATAATVRKTWTCAALKPFGDDVRQWCDANCNSIPSFCPSTYCRCVRL